MAFLQNAGNSAAPWRVLLVDDEVDVHDVTRMALARFVLDGRHLEFLHAYSGHEAKALLERESDIALILLDVVMEHEHAGLELVHWLRNVQRNTFTRIVLRTGQPGQAPEEKVIVDYDINDYKEKTELDRKKLFTTVFAALRAYRDLIKVEEARQFQERYRIGLERVISSSAKVFAQRNLRDFASGLLQQIVALLRLDEQGLLVNVKGLSAMPGATHYEILAQIGNAENAAIVGEAISEDILAYLNRACLEGKSIFENDILVCYFVTQQQKISLLYLQGVRQLDDVDHDLLEVFSASVALAFDNLLLNQEIVDTQSELIYRLGDVVESRSHEAGNHVKRIAELCYLLARLYGLDETQAELIRRASPMHDIGKIATPDAVLLKPGKLDDAEWAIMKQHPEIGYHLLSGSHRPILHAAATIAHQHHEKFDGSGYPQGLQGKAIHLFARIVAVADVFDALTHARCYKPAWTVDATREHMQQASGPHLDPDIVNLLLDNLDKANAISLRFPD